MKPDPGFPGISALRESASEVQPPFAAAAVLQEKGGLNTERKGKYVYLLADQKAV